MVLVMVGSVCSSKTSPAGSGGATGGAGGGTTAGSGGATTAATGGTGASGGADTGDASLKDALDAPSSDVTVKPFVDAFAPDIVADCVVGAHRCRGTDPIVQACSPAGQWRDETACDYVCSAGACIGECVPGYRRRCRATGEIPQVCNPAGAWVDEPACAGSTPHCATGQCVTSCLNAGQDCTDPKTACCADAECVSTSERTFACKAIPACASPGSDCAANVDCCAGLDCTAGKCAARSDACFDTPNDGICDGSDLVAKSGAGCCPGTVCGRQFAGDPLGCAIPATTKPQEGDCPRDQPAYHDACRATKFGLNCTYSDWSGNGIFYACTCNYHGWSCTKGYYVH
jgi:hypothetical protein